jgi:hypothetical protein
MSKKIEDLSKIRDGNWFACRNPHGTIWHVYFKKKHYARVLQNTRMVQYSRPVEFRKAYYLNRFLNRIIKRFKK